ncbi:hypothetical protein MLD38_015486 [Melastoma candidum]|uniref:Uncharacterized protein n=1 Tax=Melastoma candidum TaxID=119954 RepID=A0ACB9RHF4_9MYRT|nr:hypothetical protein MLD38_015486 [Melastoma candidum]
MVKEGPCYHCGVTSTPLWRNGPPDKPILCNACGSRWRTKGTLANYTPMHLRVEPENYVDHRVVRNKSTVPISRNNEVKVLKTKSHDRNLVVAGIPSENCQSFSKVTITDDDLSNRSSSGSAMSNSESCAQFGGADASDLTGPAQSVVWDTFVPSRKITSGTRLKPSAVEQLTQDLQTILQEQQSSCFSGYTEENLLLESATPIETGHGSALIIRELGSIVREEESEASSLSINTKRRKMNDGSAYPLALFVQEKNMKSSMFPSSQGMELGTYRRESFLEEKAYLLGSPHSPLLSIELKDMINFEVFMKHLTSEEQHELMKYLPAVDKTAKPLESVRSLFTSSQFLESTTSFQHLLAEGVFDSSSIGEKGEDRKILERLVLFNLTKCKWIEHYNQVKECEVASGLPCPEGASGTKTKATKGVPTINQPIDHDSSSFNPRSLFVVPINGEPLGLDSSYTDHDQDLLLEVPSNGSFAQAELLQPAPNSTASRQESK